MTTVYPPAFLVSPVVLVIEDEPGDAMLIRVQLLEMEPGAFDVHWAQSLARAKALVNESGLRPDVILLDLNLPDSTGIATVERCRALFEAPVVVLTGLDDNASIQAAIQSGAEDYLNKGGEGAVLRRAVRYAMLRYQRDADARLSAAVFKHAREGIMITTAEGVIVDVNDAFTLITGYTREQTQGKTPRMLSSGLQSKEYYAAMWNDLLEKGHWYGEVWNRRGTGEVYAVMQTVSAVRDAQGKTKQYVALFSDITELKEHESQLDHIAHFDALTNLPNRRLLTDRLQQGMHQMQRRGKRLAVVFLDLDGFKAINDNYGHSAGDQLLIALASHMKEALREGDTLARIGGDEFVAVLIDLDETEDCVPLLMRLLAAAANPLQLGNSTLQVSASLGVTFSTHAGDETADQLLREADQAMYLAKRSGKNTYHVFNAERDR